jgi:hypothetical protein
MLPIEDRPELTALCARCGVAPEDALFGFAADQNGEVLGRCLSRLEGDRVQVLGVELAAEDWMMLDGLIRAALHYGQRRGAQKAAFAPAIAAAYPSLCERLTFDTKRECQIDEILTKCKS